MRVYACTYLHYTHSMYAYKITCPLKHMERKKKVKAACFRLISQL